jgi:hypothetical protein
LRHPPRRAGCADPRARSPRACRPR